VSTILENRSKVQRSGSARINLRVRAQIKARLVRAAKLQHLKLTEFMIKSSQVAAETALAEQTRFVLNAQKWREFNMALDSAPREIPALRKLLRERPVFDAS